MGLNWVSVVGSVYGAGVALLVLCMAYVSWTDRKDGTMSLREGLVLFGLCLLWPLIVVLGILGAILTVFVLRGDRRE
jgi:hypothetical protein